MHFKHMFFSTFLDFFFEIDLDKFEDKTMDDACAVCNCAQTSLFLCVVVKVLVDYFYSTRRLEKALVLYEQCQTSVAWKICHRNHHLQAAVSRAEHWATESSGGPIPHSRNGVTDTQAAA